MVLSVATVGCARIDPGLEVEVTLEVQPRASVDVARLSVTSVRLVPCDEVLAALAPVASAWAHGAAPLPDSPLRAAVAVDLDLLTPGVVPLATLRPAPVVVCGVELGVSPSAASATWGGTTLLVDVTREGATRRFVSTSGRTTRVTSLPLTLGEQRRTARLPLTLDTTALATLDPAASDARRALLDEVLASLTLAETP